MAQLTDYVQYLSKEIGPRPTGTEEEQRAAFYIAERLQEDANLPAAIEDFTGSADSGFSKMIICAVTIVVAVVSIFLPIFLIPAAIITIVAAVLFAAEIFNRPILSRFLARGASQNVVARYEPAAQAGRPSRSRKVILIANYDSGKADPGFLRFLDRIPAPIPWIVLGAMVFIPVFLLFRLALFPDATGGGAAFANVLIIIAAILCAIPVVKGLTTKLAPYSEGANRNAAGVAVMMDVARRIGDGMVRDDEESTSNRDVDIMGPEQAALEGLVPDGAQLEYDEDVLEPEIEPNLPERNYSEEERLTAAKAAIAALTGRPVSPEGVGDLSQNLVKVKSDDDTDYEFIAQQAVAAADADASAAAQSMNTVEEPVGDEAEAQLDAADEVSDEPEPTEMQVKTIYPTQEGSGEASAYVPLTLNLGRNRQPQVPSWFISAQQKAKRSDYEAVPVQRSQYADALEAGLANRQAAARAEAEAAARAAAAAAAAARAEAEAAAAEKAVAAEAEAATASSEEVWGEVPIVTPSDPDYAVWDKIEPVVGDEPVQAEKPAELENEDEARESVSFIDQWKQHEEEQLNREHPDRTSDRVDMTAANLDSSGRVEVPEELRAHPARHNVALPSISLDDMSDDISVEAQKQRAPLAASAEDAQEGAKSLLSFLPSIDASDLSAEEGTVGETTNPSQSGVIRALRTKLPSMSGSISDKPIEAKAVSSVSTVGSFGAAGATGAFQPVGDELLEDVAPEDIYIDDADDSGMEDNYTETGAFAGPDYVDMPKSRAGGFFGRFRRNKSEKQETPQEWLEVDDDFDPREVGAARGGWESFRNDDAPTEAMRPIEIAEEDDLFGSQDDFDDFNRGYGSKGGRWEGGAFSTDRADDGEEIEPSDESLTEKQNSDILNSGTIPRITSFQAVETEVEDVLEGEVEDALDGKTISMPELYDAELIAEEEAQDALDGRTVSMPELYDAELIAEEEALASGGAILEERISVDANDLTDAQIEAQRMRDEVKQVYRFHNPEFPTEVWFVALGSESGQHSGIRAFLSEHADELRGSIIVELEGLGAGELSLVESEGSYFKSRISSRMKRYAQKASRNSGVPLGKVTLPDAESAAFVAQQRGLLAMHLIGAEDGTLALSAAGEDVLENIDEDTLISNVDYIVQLIKSI